MSAANLPWIDEIADYRLKLMIDSEFTYASQEIFDGIVRNAFILLEQRIRAVSGLDEHLFGKDLIDKAFAYPNGALQPISTSPGECDGLHHLLVGIFLFYRNPVAHRTLGHSEEQAKTVLKLIDHALSLIAFASEAVVDISKFVSPHEGQILKRHDYRIDIDNDSEKEIIVFLELGPTSVDGHFGPRLATVIIDKVGGQYVRIPAESWFGSTSYGPGVVRTINITGQAVPDLMIGWSYGMSSTYTVLLRKKDNKYVVARREEIPGVQDTWMPSGSFGFLTHYMQEFELADFDGDGITEIIQVMHAHGIDLEQFGVDREKIPEGDVVQICRVQKWDEQKELLVQVHENIMVESTRPQGSLSFLRAIGSAGGGDKSEAVTTSDAEPNLESGAKPTV